MNLIDFKIKSEQLLAIWIYLYGYKYMLTAITDLSAPMFYFANIFLFIIAVIINREFGRRIVCFWMIYCIVALLNVVIVDYMYYAFLEAFSALIIFSPCFYIISFKKFSLENFLKYWYKIAQLNLLFVIICILLQMHKLVDYGVYTYICLPNIMIMSYVTIGENKKNLFDKINIAINIVVIAILGGRMAAFASITALLIVFYLAKGINCKWKILVSIVISIAAVIIYDYFFQLLEYANVMAQFYDINSRTLYLLSQQFISGEDLQLSDRDYIYKIAKDYVWDRSGMPGGFGIILNLTMGHFYHPHNLILQSLILLGLLGTIFLFVVVIYRLYKIRNKRHKELIYFLFSEYLILSMSGASLLTHYASLLVFSFLFFYKDYY